MTNPETPTSRGLTPGSLLRPGGPRERWAPLDMKGLI